jgi:c-di-GMP-binding flagellar brake protein YcgR
MYQLLHVAPRKSCRVPVRMKIYGKSKRAAISGHAENISISGMLFRCGSEFYEGDMMTCSFSLPDSTEIAADAEIVRVIERGAGHQANRYGMKFIDIGSDFSTAIESFVERECQHA